MSISPDKYNVENARTLSELHRCCKFAASKTKERCGEQEPPLFSNSYSTGPGIYGSK